MAPSISPSVYVVFKDVSATNGCGILGRAYANVTIPYGPSELSTLWSTDQGPLNYADLYSNCSELAASISRTFVCQSDGANTTPDCSSQLSANITYNDVLSKHCFPRLEFPTRLTSYHPNWASCFVDHIDRFIYDPPRTLEPAHAMVTSPIKGDDSTISAAPASSAVHSLPTITSAASVSQPSETPQIDPKRPPSVVLGAGNTVEPTTSDLVQDPLSGFLEGLQTGTGPPIPLVATISSAQFSGSERTQGTKTQDQTAQDSGKNQNRYPQMSDTIQTGQNEPVATPPVAALGPTPDVLYAGSTIKADVSSQYTIPGIGILSPGGLALTTNDAVYSLADSATAIYKNGYPALLTPAVAVSEPKKTPVLTYGDSTYTADPSSRFDIAGQTLFPGGVIEVSGTSLTLASDGAVAAVRASSSNQDLMANTPQDPSPRLIFSSSTYAPNPFGDFLIAGQTLRPGGAIVVSGTPVSLGAAGTVAVIGTSSQFLAVAPAAAKPVSISHGSTNTADPSSALPTDRQSLSTGGSSPVNSVSVSADPQASSIVIGSSTRNLDTGTVTDGQSATNRTVPSVSGTQVSATPNTTSVLASSNTDTAKLGSLIMNGFGHVQTGAVAATGGAQQSLTLAGSWALLVMTAGLHFIYHIVQMKDFTTDF